MRILLQIPLVKIAVKETLETPFFLAGTLGGKAERECTITEGQDILIPIVNTICIKTEEEETEESLLAICKDITDQAKNLQLIIDGKHV
jgi:hypothetical protein